MKRWLVFTDLDGTLLDESYSWDLAQPAIDLLRSASIPIILNSSKTAAEMENLRIKMKLETYCIAENGSIITKNYTNSENQIFDTSVRDHLVEIAGKLRREHNYKFEGYMDWCIDDLIQLTGLTGYEAECSMKRQATEPIIWNDTQDRLFDFMNQLRKLNVVLIKGGQFMHLMIANQSKGKAMEKVVNKFKLSDPDSTWHTVALGDSQNDFSMIERADVGILIPKKKDNISVKLLPNARRASFPSTKGWNEAVLNWFSEINKEVLCE